jgi:hypothetical protein
MTYFKGKNEIKSIRRLISERIKYQTQSYIREDEDEAPPQVVDFNFAERTLYGRVDRQLNPVIPNENFLFPLVSTNSRVNTVRVMNFVGQQFKDLESHYIRACRLGVIPKDDPILSTLQAKRGYESPTDLFNTYIPTVMDVYVNDFLASREQQIDNFKDFLFNFPEFMEKMSQVFPVTFSGFQRSNHSSIFTSGLAIDIGEIPFGDDEMKEELMFTKPAFQYYVNLARQYGFSVNKRNPSVLVSDLAGPATIVYRNNLNLSSINSIFSKQFIKTIDSDLSKFRKMLVDYYNSFVTKFRFKQVVDVCLNRTVIENYTREYININNINLYYNNIIYLYFFTRNIEERKPYSDSQIKTFFETAIRIGKKSESAMMNYIDDQFKAVYNQKDGSLTYYNEKLQKQLDNE